MTGRTVERGRLKVDARRAALKLKDHILGDPSTWLCEIVRAAHAASATKVDIQWDADDLFVRFDGAPWPADVLDRAAIGAAESEPADDRRIRRFALGAIAALGDGAKRVTVHIKQKDGLSAASVDVRSLEAPERPDPKKTRPAPKDGGAVDSMCLHVERPIDLSMLGRALGLSTPRDVRSLEKRLRAGAVATSVRGRLLSPAAGPEPLVALPVEGQPWTMRLELLASWSAPPTVSFVERGLELAVHPLWPAEELSGCSVRGVWLPIRAIVEADEVPSNVSRSRVQDEMVADVRRAALDALPALIDAARRATASAFEEDNVARSGSLVSSLLAIAVVLTDPRAGSDAVAGALRPVLDLPLLVDACGRRRAVRELRRTRRLYARGGATPLPPSYAPLAKNVFALGPEPLPMLLAQSGVRSYAEISERVDAGVERRRAVLASPPVPFGVDARPDQTFLHRMQIEGFDVALAMTIDGSFARENGVTFFLDGRPFERVAVSRHPGAPVIDAVVAGEHLLSPAPGYDAIERDGAFDRIMALLPDCAAYAIAEWARDAPPERQGDLRAAIAGQCAGSVSPEAAEVLENIAAWQVLGAAAPMRLRVLRQIHVAHGGLRWISPQEANAFRERTGGVYLGLAPVLILDRRDHQALSALLRGALVHYGQWIERPTTSTADMVRALESEIGAGVPIYTFEDETVPFAVAPWTAPVLLRMHRGQVVSVASKAPHIGCCAVVVDEDYLLPASDARPVGLPPILSWVQAKLLGSIITYPHKVTSGPWMPAFDFIADRLETMAKAARKELLRSPLFRVIVDGKIENASADAITRRFPSQKCLPVMPPPADPRAWTGVTAVVAEGPERRVLGALLNVAMRDVGPPRDESVVTTQVVAVDSPEPPKRKERPPSDPPTLAELTGAVECLPFRPEPGAPPAVIPPRVVERPAPRALTLTERLESEARDMPFPSGTRFRTCAKGRPVAFDERRKEILVNTADPVIEQLVALDDCMTIVAAALSEANREVSAVTDAEEARALHRIVEASIGSVNR